MLPRKWKNTVAEMYWEIQNIYLGMLDKIHKYIKRYLHREN